MSKYNPETDAMIQALFRAAVELDIRPSSPAFKLFSAGFKAGWHANKQSAVGDQPNA